MQKKLIALAVAAAISAPAFADNANVTIYGKVHTTVEGYNGNSNIGGSTVNGTNIASNASRLGFKGSEDLGGDLKAVYQYETQVEAQGSSALFSTQRDTYIGLAGGFGTVVAGRLPLANQYANDANFFGEKVGDAGNFTAGGFGAKAGLTVPSRINRAIGYVSPTFAGGVTLTVGFVPNTPESLAAAGTQNVSGKDSSYTLRAAYDNNGIFGGFSYLNVGAAGLATAQTATVGAAGTNVAGGAPTAGSSNFAQTGAKISIMSLAGGYDFGVAKIRAQVVTTSANAEAAFALNRAATGGKQTVIALGGQVNVGNGAIKLQLASASNLTVDSASPAISAVGDNTASKLFAIGYDYNLSKRTTVYAAWAKVFNGNGAAYSVTGYAHGGPVTGGTTGAGANTVTYSPSALSLGVMHTF